MIAVIDPAAAKITQEHMDLASGKAVAYAFDSLPCRNMLVDCPRM